MKHRTFRDGGIRRREASGGIFVVRTARKSNECTSVGASKGLPV
jgi:hypothetical protein